MLRLLTSHFPGGRIAGFGIQCSVFSGSVFSGSVDYTTCDYNKCSHIDCNCQKFSDFYGTTPGKKKHDPWSYARRVGSGGRWRCATIRPHYYGPSDAVLYETNTPAQVRNRIAQGHRFAPVSSVKRGIGG